MNTAPIRKKKSLGMMDLLLGMICLIFFLDTIGPTAAMGPSAVTWYIIIAAIFFIPSGFIIAEQGSTYPDEGGMYTWVKRAYGRGWGARVSWYYWLNNAVWISSATVFLVQVFAQIFLPTMSFWSIIVTSIVVTWIYLFIAMIPMKNSKWLNNIAAICKLVIAVGIILCGVVFLIKNGQPANDLSLANFKPSLGASFMFFPALIYNLLGFDAMSTMGSQMKNPTRDVPKAIITNAILITALYILTVLAILIIMPYEEMNIVESIMNAFIFTLGSGGFTGFLVYLVGVMFLITLMFQGVLWMVAASTMASESAQSGELPKAFGIMHKKYQTPVGGLVLIGIIGTCLTIIYALMANSAEELFWTLFSFTSIIFLLPYIINFNAFLKLRKVDKDIKRPYKFPGPPIFGTFFARLSQLILAFTILVFFWVPGEPPDWSAIVPLLIGVLLALLIGELITRHSLKKQAAQDNQ